MNLSALHEAVWEMVRDGCLAEDSGPDDTPLSEAEQMAIRAWQRRLRCVGGIAAQLMPPNLILVWLASPSPPDVVGSNSLSASLML